MNIAGLGKSPNADALVEDIYKYGLERHIVELDAYGFTLVPPETLRSREGFVDDLRDAILHVSERRNNVQYGDYRTATEAVDFNSNNWWLLEEDDVFVESTLNPVVLTLARWMCGRSAVLTGTASIIKPPKPADVENTGDYDDVFKHSHLPLHNDNHAFPPPLPEMCHWVNTSWVLTDYATPEDGPTVLVPGSHRFGRVPFNHEQNWWEETNPYQAVPLQAPAGSLAVWHGFTWHGAMERTKPGLRVSLVLVWARAFIKPVNQWREDGISPELIERYPELHTALGMDSLYPSPKSGEAPLMERVEPFMRLGQDKYA
jgi:hypothetical protein